MESMNTEIRAFVEEEALEIGCPKPLVEFANISDIPNIIPENFPFKHAVSIATPIDPNIVAGLENGPTLEYYNEILELRKKLEIMEKAVCEMLKTKGFDARTLSDSCTNKLQSEVEESPRSSSGDFHPLSHRIVATHAGLGWIGKNGLIITKHYGPAVLLSTIVTNAPVDCCTEVFLSRCARCMECINICPANAINPFEWSHRMEHKEIVNKKACREMCHELSMNNFGKEADICGLCVYACPYTKAYLQRNGIIKY